MKTATEQRKIQALCTYGSVKKKYRKEREKETIKEICTTADDPKKKQDESPNKKQRKDQTKTRKKEKGKMG